MNMLGNTDRRAQMRRVVFFLAAILLLVKLIRDQNKDLELNQVTGQTMGTIQYNVKYLSEEPMDYGVHIDSLLRAFNNVLSTYVPDSEISIFNKTNRIVFNSEFFYPVLETSKVVHERTNGAFDPTIGPLVNAWGFGPDKAPVMPDSIEIRELLRRVDFEQVQFDRYTASMPEGMYLDFSAIAKGYAVDIVAELLESEGIAHYMVEIGGEVRTRGYNEKKKVWAIGIEDPLVDKFDQRLLAVASIETRGIATSGNYRNYYEKDGKVYAHIIDPRTGYSNNSSLLSASVFHANCMTADAYATAFMVLGLEASKKIIEAEDGLEAFLIYRGEEGIAYYISAGIQEGIQLLNEDL